MSQSMEIIEDDEDKDDRALSHHLHAAPPSPPRYAKDDKVYALDQHHYYPATIRDVQWYHPTSPSKEAAGTAALTAGTWRYKIHYQGWNARWDCWRTNDQISTDVAALDAAGLLASTANSKTKETSTTAMDLGTASTPPPRKRKAETHEGTTSPLPGAGSPMSIHSPPAKKQSRRSSGPAAAAGRAGTTATLASAAHRDKLVAACALPMTLQAVLYEEWERLVQRRPSRGSAVPQRLLHQLPAHVTIHHVLQQYQKSKQKQHQQQQQRRHQEKEERAAPGDGENQKNVNNNNSSNNPAAVPSLEDVAAVCQGLTDVFQVALPSCLLYPEERPQYEALIQQRQQQSQNGHGDPATATSTSSTPPPYLTNVYGCEYLLRLYVRLPDLLPLFPSNSTHTTTTVTTLATVLADLLRVLQKNRLSCFAKGTAAYRPVTRDEWSPAEVRYYEYVTTARSRGSGEDTTAK